MPPLIRRTHATRYIWPPARAGMRRTPVASRRDSRRLHHTWSHVREAPIAGRRRNPRFKLRPAPPAIRAPRARQSTKGPYLPMAPSDHEIFCGSQTPLPRLCDFAGPIHRLSKPAHHSHAPSTSASNVRGMPISGLWRPHEAAIAAVRDGTQRAWRTAIDRTVHKPEVAGAKCGKAVVGPSGRRPIASLLSLPRGDSRSRDRWPERPGRALRRHSPQRPCCRRRRSRTAARGSTHRSRA